MPYVEKSRQAFYSLDTELLTVPFLATKETFLRALYFASLVFSD